MRLIRYYIVNKNTNKAIYTDCNRAKCVEMLNTLEKKDEYFVGYKWMSI